jgi:nondiscriminating glutamyl-tRNA synthetase
MSDIIEPLKLATEVKDLPQAISALADFQPTEPQIVRTRFAPSPTGYLHVGGLRTALFAYLYAKHHQGQFILRIEDTDQARFIEGAIEKLAEVMQEMGLHYDEGVFVEDGKLVNKGDYGPYQQSERKAIYREYADQLIKSGHAYYCFCDEKRLSELRKEQEALKQPPRYDKKCRYLSEVEVGTNLDAGKPYVIRQAIPEDGQTTIRDLVYKDIVIDNKILDDQVLLKSDGFPTYHLAVVVDDHLMQITHVIRGEEWIPSAPKHVLLYKAFNWDAPHFAHLPLLLNKDRSKLSKRQGDVAVEDYLAKGYLKEALINFVAMLGWNPKTNQEIFSMDELISQFDLTKVNKASAVFDVEKLDWINGHYLRKLTLVELAQRALPYLLKAELISRTEKEDEFKTVTGRIVKLEFIEKMIALEQERLKKLSELTDRVPYFFDQPKYDPQILIWKKSNLERTRENLSGLLQTMQNLTDSDFTRENMEAKIKAFIAEKGTDNGSVLWPMRVALSGMEASPGPFEIAEVLHFGYGKYEVLQRLETALNSLK